MATKALAASPSRPSRRWAKLPLDPTQPITALWHGLLKGPLPTKREYTSIAIQSCIDIDSVMILYDLMNNIIHKLRNVRYFSSLLGNRHDGG